jgi:prepilin-type N-terminal cleavage/methylation domain-containing protein
MKMLFTMPMYQSVRSALQPSRRSLSRRLSSSHSLPGHSSSSRSPSGFTLVEMLVVITIIGILAALVTAAVMMALRRGRIASQVTEIRQLEAAVEAYKQKYGEYPPDFTGISSSSTDAQNAVLRHLAKVFPRYQPGISTGTATNNWAGFCADVKAGWNMDISTTSGLLSPTGALTFWLGGCPDWKTVSSSTSGAVALGDTTTYVDPKTPVAGFLGFSANPLNPFDSSTSRIAPVFDFNPNCLYYQSTGSNGGIGLWTSTAYRASNVASPIVYFRSNNATYYQDGSTSTFKSCANVYPAIDTRLSNLSTPTYVWVNPNSIQIFSSGLDRTYSSLTAPLQFPAGGNYGANTYDDVTNFSGGTLEDAIP